jgi:hypothetical protein
MRTKVLATLAAAALLPMVSAAPAQANHSWNGYHWARTANPFTLQLGDNVSAAWDSHLATASSDWSKSTVLDTVVAAGKTRPRNCKATTGRVEVCNSTYGSTGWLGVASISVTVGSHITAGTVKLNYTYFNTATYDTPEWRQLVTCQEVGHTFGLDHQDENFDNANLGTCMDYTNDPSTNQHPNSHDYDELVTIYSHLDDSTTVGITSSRQQPQVGSDPSTWGKRVEGSRATGHSTFVRDFGHGNYVVTFVTWA